MEENQTPSTTACVQCSNPEVVEGYSTPLCSACRQQFIKYPIPIWIKIFAGAIGLLVIVALFYFPKSLSQALHLERGKKAAEQKKYLTAQRELSVFVKAFPRHTEAQGHLMLAAFYNNDFQTFTEVGRKIMNEPIEDDHLLSNLKWAAKRFEEYYPADSLKPALEPYLEVGAAIPDSLFLHHLARNPEDVYALFLYASSLYDRNEYTRCDSLLELVLVKDDAYLPAMRLEASAQREMGHWEAADKYCNQILNINKESAYAIASKARTALKQHKDKAALDLALESVEVDKEDGYSAATLVLAYHFNNHTAERDALISSLRKLPKERQDFVQYAVDVINKKEPFRN